MDQITLYLYDQQNSTGHPQIFHQGLDSDSNSALEPNEITLSYSLGYDVLSQAHHDTTTYSFLYDGHGSTRALLDTLGAVAPGQRFRYDAYGTLLGIDQATALTTLLYSGEQTDRLLGNQYLRARYYDFATGTFGRLDPFKGREREPQTYHKYLYTHANPIWGRDPTGLCNDPEWFRPLVLGTRVCSFLGAKYKAAAQVAGEDRWSNQQIRTTVRDLKGVELPITKPYTDKPDFVGFKVVSGDLYELKRGKLSGVNDAGQFNKDASKAINQLNRYQSLLEAHTGSSFTFGVNYLGGVTPHPTFYSPYMPKNSMLITFTNYAVHSGVILYDFVEKSMGERIQKLVREVGGSAAAVHIINLSIQNHYIGQQLGRAASLANTGQQASRAHLNLAASIGGGAIGVGLAGGFSGGF